MSYSTAESHAKKAAQWAASVPGSTSDQAMINLAISVQELAKAVGEIARELKSDQ